MVGVGATAGLGWLLLIATSYAVPSIPDLLGSELPLPMGQVFLDVLGKRGMLAIWSCIIIVQVRIILPMWFGMADYALSMSQAPLKEWMPRGSSSLSQGLPSVLDRRLTALQFADFCSGIMLFLGHAGGRRSIAIPRLQ